MDRHTQPGQGGGQPKNQDHGQRLGWPGRESISSSSQDRDWKRVQDHGRRQVPFIVPELYLVQDKTKKQNKQLHSVYKQI